MKSDTYELHNYADLSMSTSEPILMHETRKRKAANTAINNISRRDEKYSLRQKRRNASAARHQSDNLLLPNEEEDEEERPPQQPLPTKQISRRKTAAKTKTKAAPLSKYRRKTANARERTRMREINMAFEHLRHCVPQAITGDDNTNANEKLTKITTLRLAMKYIAMLSESLQNPSEHDDDFLEECLRESELRQPHEFVMECEPIAEPQPVAKPKKQKTTSNKKTPTKRQSKQQQQQQQQAAVKTPSNPTNIISNTTITTATTVTTSSTTVHQLRSPESCYASSSIGSPAGSCAAACSPSSAYASLSSSNCGSSSDNGSTIIDADSLLGMHALSELNTLLLESDGESLQLSDHCLSPNYNCLLTTPFVTCATAADASASIMPARGDMPMSMSSLDKADMELSLRLLESSGDSFDFTSSDQQPSACISPLANLDSFNPFSDLLHTEFTEPNTLDLFS